MQKLGKKRLKLHLQGRIEAIPAALAPTISNSPTAAAS